MSTYIIQIQWINTKEWIYFNPENLPGVGDMIETTERWSEPSDELVHYQAQVLNVSVKGTTYVLDLEYLEDENEMLRDRNVAWGTSRITVQLEQTPKAEAVWSNLLPDAYFDGPAQSVVLSEQALIEELGYVATEAKKRKQHKFRKALESRSLVCEISGESEPSALQAAHIIEVGNSGGYGRSNGLLLRADIHALYDSGLLYISDQGEISVSEFLSAQSKYHVEMQGWTLSPSTLREVAQAIRKRNSASEGSFEEFGE
jgi:hypothetical protein